MNSLHNYLVVFGGHAENGDFLNDVFIFNSSDNEWYFMIKVGLNQ